MRSGIHSQAILLHLYEVLFLFSLRSALDSHSSRWHIKDSRFATQTRQPGQRTEVAEGRVTAHVTGKRTLKVAFFVLGLAVERDLGDLLAEQVSNSLVRDIAHLVVVLHDFSSLIAHSTIAGLHQGVTCFILRADVAVDA
jgi:hypothetical protein